MIQIVFLEPKTAGNVGAIARAMANFNLKNLILINPECDHLSKEALDRAKHAKTILENLEIISNIDELKTKLKCDYLIGTSAALGNDYNIPRSPIRPDQLAQKLKERGIGSGVSDPEASKGEDIKIGLIIGREGDGLSNEEIQKCDFIVTIPTFPDYPALNASHAATILFYELFKASKDEKIDEHIPLATENEKNILMNLVEKHMDSMQFATEEKKETQRKVWKHLIGKSFLTKREAMALIGFMKKLG